MICKQDCRKAILDRVFQEFTDGRYTFTRVSTDTIQVNNRQDNRLSKAQSTGQAKAIANELIDRAKKSFNGHVSGYINQVSPYDPITVTFTPSQSYIDHVFSQISVTEKSEEVAKKEELERDYVNNNTGPNTQYSLAPSSGIAIGVYPKYVKHKKSTLYTYYDRLGKIKVAKQKVGITTTELANLNKQEKELNNLIHGNPVLGITGLEEEIAEIEQVADVASVSYYIEKDLGRLEKLVQSNNIDDLREADRLIQFYTNAGEFDWNKPNINPFFEKADIFDIDPNTGKFVSTIKDPATKEQFEKWSSRAKGYRNELQKRQEELFVDTVNNNTLVKNTYKGKQFTSTELTDEVTGLKDIDVISMWVMDVNSGIFSHNGILPQVMYSELLKGIEEKSHWSRGIAERVDKILPKVETVLKNLDNGAHTLKGIGVLGLQGVSYNLFKDTTKEGNETGALVTRYTNEYNAEEERALNILKQGLKSARSIPDSTIAFNFRNKIMNAYTDWRRRNSIILDITKIPEIANDPEFDDLGAIADPSYKAYLESILGKKGYEEEVENQKAELVKYLAAKDNLEETLLDKEGVTDVLDLSDTSKNELAAWENKHNPRYGVEHYHTANGRLVGSYNQQHFMDFNHFIPRNKVTKVTYDNSTNTAIFTEDPNTDTGNYNKQFAKIEANPDLLEFYNIAKEVTRVIRENTPYELQQQLPANTLPALRKVAGDLLLDRNVGGLKAISPAFRTMIDKVRTGFGVTRQNDVSNANIDNTGKANYTVNDDFLRANSKAISTRRLIEETRFMEAWNSNITKSKSKMTSIGAFTERELNTFNTEALLLIAEYTHTNISLADIKAGRLDAIRAKTGDRVKVGKLISDYALNNLVQSQSFDLPKICKYFSDLTMTYAARQEALPIMEVMKKYYDNIQKPETNNTSNPIYNTNDKVYQKNGLRTRAITQMASQFERTFLGNTGQKHIGELGKVQRSLSSTQLAKINNQIADIDTQIAKLDSDNKDYQSDLKKLQNRKYRLYSRKLIPTLGRKIYTTEERLRVGELQELIEKNPNSDKGLQLQKAQENIGKTRTATAILDGLLGWINVLKLGYNLSSMTTNFIEGMVSNMTLAASNQYFNRDEIYYGYKVMRRAFIKNATFGYVEPKLAKKARTLMDRFNVVVDSRNELQKSSHKSYSNKLEWAKWSSGNQRVEYVNQGALMIATLRSTKIKGLAPNTESSVWDAYDTEGKLLPNYRTPENIANWEGLDGEQYTIYKNNLDNIIIKGHGNYSQMRGMMAKTGPGKIFLTFKTWLPEALAWRLGSEKPDILSGTEKSKGLYRSYTPTGAAIHGGIVGLAAFGPIGAVVGGAVGAVIGRFGNNNVDTGVGVLRQTVDVTKALALKALGMPINTIVGKAIIKENDSFDKWIGSGSRGTFTQQDANNLRANVADIALQLSWILMILVVKGLFWDDDDKPDSNSRIAHNILINKLTQLSSQAGSYTNLPDIYNNTIGSIGLIQYLTDLGKETTAIEKYLEGTDVISTGVNAGQSRLARQTNKLLLPGLFKDPFSLGFETQAKTLYHDSPLQSLFTSEEKKDAKVNKGLRARMRTELKDREDIKAIEDEKERSKYIESIINSELPTPAQLKKLGLTRDEYETLKDEQQNQ